MVFASDKEEEEMELPVIKIDVTGRKNLWGKTKKAVVEAFNEYEDEIDWIFKVIWSGGPKNVLWVITG